MGGLRPFKLHQFLREKGVDSLLIVPQALDSHEFEIKEPNWWVPLGFLKKAFPPDPSIFWACKVAFELRLRNKDKHFYLLTTCPPNGLVIAGLVLKILKVNFTWILDFRDIWTKHPIYNPPLTKRFIDPWLERLANFKADLIIANTDWDQELGIKMFPSIENKVITIRNGVDDIQKDIPEIKENGYSRYRFIYTGGTTAGQATIKICDFLQELNDSNIPSFCDFYGEFDEGMNNRPYTRYRGTINYEEVSQLLRNYRFGFIYLPVGSEKGGRISQKFYDYLGAGVIPVCFRASKEMIKLMNSLNTGISISDDTKPKDAIRMLETARFNAKSSDLISFTRNFQFTKLYKALANLQQ